MRRAGKVRRGSRADGTAVGKVRRRSRADGTGAGKVGRRCRADGTGAGKVRRRSRADGTGAGKVGRRSRADGTGAGKVRRRSRADGTGEHQRRRSWPPAAEHGRPCRPPNKVGPKSPTGRRPPETGTTGDRPRPPLNSEAILFGNPSHQSLVPQ